MAYLRHLPPTDRLPQRWQVLYRSPDDGKQRSAGVFTTKFDATRVRRRLEHRIFQYRWQLKRNPQSHCDTCTCTSAPPPGPFTFKPEPEGEVVFTITMTEPPSGKQSDL